MEFKFKRCVSVVLLFISIMGHGFAMQSNKSKGQKGCKNPNETRNVYCECKKCTKRLYSTEYSTKDEKKLRDAIVELNLKVVKDCASKADLNCLTDDHHSGPYFPHANKKRPLHLAVNNFFFGLYDDKINKIKYEKALKILSLLLKNGAYVDPIDALRRTPLICAISLGDYEMAKMLIGAGANVNFLSIYTEEYFRSDSAGEDVFLSRSKMVCNPLEMVLRYSMDNPDTIKFLKLLLDSGARHDIKVEGDPVIFYIFKDRPLSRCDDWKHQLKPFMDRNLNLNLRNSKGESILDIIKRTRDYLKGFFKTFNNKNLNDLVKYHKVLIDMYPLYTYVKNCEKPEVVIKAILKYKEKKVELFLRISEGGEAVCLYENEVFGEKIEKIEEFDLSEISHIPGDLDKLIKDLDKYDEYNAVRKMGRELKDKQKNGILTDLKISLEGLS